MKLLSDGCCGCGKYTTGERGCQLQQHRVSISLLGLDVLSPIDVFEEHG